MWKIGRAPVGDTGRVSSRVLAATLLSLTTAFLYALSNVLQMLEAEKVPDEYALRAGLMLAARSSARAGCSASSPMSADS